MSVMKKVVHAGDKVKVSLPGREYEGTALGISPMKTLRSGEPAEQYEISVQCSCCGHVEPWPERYVEKVG